MARRPAKLIRKLRLWMSLVPILIGGTALGLSAWVGLFGRTAGTALEGTRGPMLAALLGVLGIGILAPMGRVRRKRTRLLLVATRPLPRPTVVGLLTIGVVGLLLAQAPGESQPATQNLLYLMASSLLGLLLANLLLGGGQLKYLTVSRSVPATAVCGEPIALTVNLRNLARIPAGVVHIKEAVRPGIGMRQHETAVLWIAGRSSASASTQAVFMRRGVHRLGRIRISSAFPFGLVRHVRTLWANGEVLVLPRRIEPPAGLLREIAHHRQMVGSARRVRGSDDVVGLREYQAGDPVARIHWPTSARAGHPMLLEFDAPSHPPVMVLVDCWQSEKLTLLAARSQFETLVCMAAGLTHRLLHQDHAVGLHLAGGELVRPGSGQGAWNGIMQALARCNRQSGDPADWLAQLLGPVRDGMVAVLVTARDSESLPRVPGLAVMAIGDPSVQAMMRNVRGKSAAAAGGKGAE